MAYKDRTCNATTCCGMGPEKCTHPSRGRIHTLPIARKTLTYDEAVKLMPRRKSIHTFAGFLGADWNRDSVLDLLKKADRIEANDPGTTMFALGHPIAVLRPNGRWLHIEGKK